MLNRLVFFFIAAFWVVMNVLLWRAEFTKKGEIASTVPAEKVWEKVLTAPDSSSLEILHHGKKVGYCRWSARVGEQAAGQVLSEDFVPGEMIEAPSSYVLELEGNVAMPGISNSLRFDFTILLSTNQAWQEMNLRISLRPSVWEITSKAADETVHLRVDDESGVWEQTYKMADLQNPEMLLSELGGPWAMGLLGSLGLRSSQTNLSNLSLGLEWTARNDHMQFGHSKVRVYRLEAKLVDRYKIYIFVSRVGEILWIEFPDKLVLSNDAFGHF